MVNALTSMFESSVDELSFKLKAGKHEESQLVVAGFAASEALSELFSWRIDVVIDPESTPTLDDTIGEDAEFRILRNDEVLRTVRGIVGEVSPQGERGNQRLVTLTLVPKLAELQYLSNNRIFQEQPVNEIVEALFKVHNVEPYWRIAGRPAPRLYRVQKNETDYQFFRRILADEGIHFHFTHDDKKTSVEFVNDPGGYLEIEGDSTLPYSDIAGQVTVDHIAGSEQQRRLRPGSVAMRDYDFEAPGKDLNAKEEAQPQNRETAARREIYIYPGDYTDASVGTTLAKRRLEAARSDALVFSGRSSCVHLEVGRRFTLDRHPDETFNRDWTITAIRVRGQRAGILADAGQGSGPGFSVSFSAVPSDINNPRPPRVPAPATHPESAQVVGPTQGSPFVDKYGRVKVQFHWDREGKRNEHSSCWLRVMTPAAGADRGIWFPPRVGDEVIIQHIDGDLDRPFVAGAIYNGVEMQPNKLPGEASKSTIKTLSIPGGKGFNELTFQDTAGGEEIFLHAQKDRRTVVLHNHNETVGANQTSSVGANQTISVGANRTVNVAAAHSVTVGKDETNTVHGHRKETVDKGEDVTITQGRGHTINEGDDKLGVTAGNRNVTVSAEDTLTANKKTDVIKTTFDLDAHTSITIHHKSDSTLTLQQNEALLKTEAKIVLTNNKSTITLEGGIITIAAADEIKLDAGGSAMLSLKKDGSLSLAGPKEVSVACKSSTVTLEPAKATVNGSAVNVTAAGMMEISGAMIKIN